MTGSKKDEAQETEAQREAAVRSRAVVAEVFGADVMETVTLATHLIADMLNGTVDMRPYPEGDLEKAKVYGRLQQRVQAGLVTDADIGTLFGVFVSVLASLRIVREEEGDAPQRTLQNGGRRSVN